MNNLFYDIIPAKPDQHREGSYVEKDTGTVVWTLKQARPVSDSLTLDDRRELAKTGLTDEAYFIKAKVVFAAGGGRKDILKACGRSPSYAAKVYAAFRRAKENMDKK